MADVTKSIPALLEQLFLTGGIKQVNTTTTASVDPASIATGAIGTITLTVTGVTNTDSVLAVIPNGGFKVSAVAEPDLTIIGATVVAADTVRVAIHNRNAGAKDADATTFTVIWLQRH